MHRESAHAPRWCVPKLKKAAHRRPSGGLYYRDDQPSIMPAPTVLLVLSSMMMKAPVERFLS